METILCGEILIRRYIEKNHRYFGSFSARSKRGSGDQRVHPVGGQSLGQVCPLLNITHQNKSHYINKILKEYFKEKIYYNYFIIK